MHTRVDFVYFQLVDLAVYLVPQDLWREHLQSAANTIVDQSISAGFIRFVPMNTSLVIMDIFGLVSYVCLITFNVFIIPYIYAIFSIVYRIKRASKRESLTYKNVKWFMFFMIEATLFGTLSLSSMNLY